MTVVALNKHLIARRHRVGSARNRPQVLVRGRGEGKTVFQLRLKHRGYGAR